jgi:hypothetical protein
MTILDFRFSKKQDSKLGNMFSFAVTPVETCVQDCNSEYNCYSKKAMTQYPNVKRAWNETRLYLLKNKDFPPLPKKPKKNIKAVRCFSAGDIERPIIILKLIRLCEKYPDYDFYLYTKTHTKNQFMGNLRKLNRVKNCNVFFSYDTATGFNFKSGFNIAGVLTNNLKAALDKKGIKYQICKHKNGKPSTNCDKCLLCVKKQRLNILFPKH